jgi:hypothetical protein
MVIQGSEKIFNNNEMLNKFSLMIFNLSQMSGAIFC